MKKIQVLISLLLISALLIGQHFTPQNTAHNFDTDGQSARKAFVLGKSNIPMQSAVNRSVEQNKEFIWSS